VLQNPAAFARIVELMAAYGRERGADAVVGVESRGFLFGAPIAAALGLPFVPVRKPGKLPAQILSVDYALEYGSGRLDIHADALDSGSRVLIVDDLLATGGTAAGAAKLVELLGASVAGFVFFIELTDLAGRGRLDGYDVHALVQL
jgi:adenine phosphoribosyltransferase